ncbi:hypothetical protein [Cryobacterium breve]|uniref:hypothetical protein n=1 Tax=Cryobacterium breve TaxID=1259258 RepID=UPI00248BD187|nr:hypothetical protein [Cryobacterium breve]
MISGPAQGVELSTGQVMRTVDGAGLVPSEATIIEMPSGRFTVAVSSFVPVNSSSQRSEPAGFFTVAAAAGAVPAGTSAFAATMSLRRPGSFSSVA